MSNLDTVKRTLHESARDIPVQSHYDVVVCGGGPAGIAAAIAAGRSGARTALIELHGCLGGVWTSGLLSYILDAREKPGLMREIRHRLTLQGALAAERDLYDAEVMKLLLEDMCQEAEVDLRLYTRLVAAKSQDRRISHIVLEAKEGRFAISADNFIDTTGDGDLGALAGAGFDIGRAGDGLSQPMTLMALIMGIPESVTQSPYNSNLGASCMNKKVLFGMLCDAGYQPSYTNPSIFALPNGLCAVMVNHQYEKSALSSRDLTEATITARQEIHRVVAAMRRFSTEWQQVRVVGTAAQIGVREGRRLHGVHQLSVRDVTQGTCYDDAVTRVCFPIDIHSIRRSDGGGYGGDNHRSEPYDIPLRSLIARDFDNLLMAGRCISGDFHAHASYRVTGNAVPTGEAVGVMAALACAEGQAPTQLPTTSVLEHLRTFREDVHARIGWTPAINLVSPHA